VYCLIVERVADHLCALIVRRYLILGGFIYQYEKGNGCKATSTPHFETLKSQIFPFEHFCSKKILRCPLCKDTCM